MLADPLAIAKVFEQWGRVATPEALAHAQHYIGHAQRSLHWSIIAHLSRESTRDMGGAIKARITAGLSASAAEHEAARELALAMATSGTLAPISGVARGHGSRSGRLRALAQAATELAAEDEPAA